MHFRRCIRDDCSYRLSESPKGLLDSFDSPVEPPRSPNQYRASAAEVQRVLWITKCRVDTLYLSRYRPRRFIYGSCVVFVWTQKTACGCIGRYKRLYARFVLCLWFLGCPARPIIQQYVLPEYEAVRRAKS
jgi:hypothetical protein